MGLGHLVNNVLAELAGFGVRRRLVIGTEPVDPLQQRAGIHPAEDVVNQVVVADSLHLEPGIEELPGQPFGGLGPKLWACGIRPALRVPFQGLDDTPELSGSDKPPPSDHGRVRWEAPVAIVITIGGLVLGCIVGETEQVGGQ